MSSEHVKPTDGVEKKPFLPYVEEKNYPQSLQPILEPYVKRMGFLPNALKLYMHRPEIAEPLWILNSRIMRDPSSTLDQGLKRCLAAVACRINQCTYCTAHCCAMLKAPVGRGPEGWGMEADEVTAMLRGKGAPRNEMERACFDFVAAASRDAGNVPDEIYGRLVQFLTPQQIVELACVVGFWKLYNTIHDSLRIPIEAHLLPETEYVNA
jgi:alkylhydroperoxidase family enzyme